MLSNTRGKELVSIRHFYFSICQHLFLCFSPHTSFSFYMTHCNWNHWDILLGGQMKGPVDWRAEFGEWSWGCLCSPLLRCCSSLTLPEVMRLGSLVSQHSSLQEKTASFVPIKHSGAGEEWMGLSLSSFTLQKSWNWNTQPSTAARTRMQEIFLSSFLGSEVIIFLFLCLSLPLFLFSITIWKKKCYQLPERTLTTELKCSLKCSASWGPVLGAWSLEFYSWGWRRWFSPPSSLPSLSGSGPLLQKLLWKVEFPDFSAAVKESWIIWAGPTQHTPTGKEWILSLWECRVRNSIVFRPRKTLSQVSSVLGFVLTPSWDCIKPLMPLLFERTEQIYLKMFGCNWITFFQHSWLWWNFPWH